MPVVAGVYMHAPMQPVPLTVAPGFLDSEQVAAKQAFLRIGADGKVLFAVHIPPIRRTKGRTS